MDISRIGGPAAANGIQRNPNANLDKDAFLKLLITQLQYQDPLNPMDDRDFLAQMAQFTSLEQMQNMNKAFALTQGYSMMGREIDASVRGETADDARELHGVVDAVVQRGGEVFLKVGGEEAPLSTVWQVAP